MWRGAPTWAKIVTTLVGLAALALVLNGLVGVRMVRGHLVDRLDRELEDAAASVGDAGRLGPADETLPSPYYVRLVSPSGSVVDERWSPPSPDEPAPALPSLDRDDARALAGRPFTVDGGPGWRVVVEPRGDRAGSLVVARSLADVDAAVAHLGRISLLAGIALLGALTAVAYLAVRRTLAAVPGIEDAALALLNGDRRARAPEDHRHSELGHIGSAFNAMADRLLAAQRAQEQAEADARRADLGLRRFVADASRELRAPLTALRDLVAAGRRAGPDDRAALADLLARIDHESRRMGRLVDDLLLLTRLDEGRPLAQGEAGPVDLARVAREATDATRVVAVDWALVSVGPGPDEALEVAGDEARLRHLVANLLDNAVTHTPPGTKVVVTASRTRRDERTWAELSVRDDGPGLTPEQARRVPDRFYRTEAARVRSPDGAGLGLAVVDAIARAHGGTLEVDTSAPTGVTFRVLLPAVEPPTPPDRLPVRAGRAGPVDPVGRVDPVSPSAG
ncbi:MAG TPA: HAMP domain-containing sensor histidine kinase [Acidimicrobiales bacterium]